jgi:hypothetical protein
MSLSATLIIWPDDEIKVITVDGRWEELSIGELDLWIGGDPSDASEITGYARLRGACDVAIGRAQARLGYPAERAIQETAEVAS